MRKVAKVQGRVGKSQENNGRLQQKSRNYMVVYGKSLESKGRVHEKSRKYRAKVERIHGWVMEKWRRYGQGM